MRLNGVGREWNVLDSSTAQAFVFVCDPASESFRSLFNSYQDERGGNFHNKTSSFLYS
jgi:hypothetical protein